VLKANRCVTGVSIANEYTKNSPIRAALFSVSYCLS